MCMGGIRQLPCSLIILPKLGRVRLPPPPGVNIETLNKFTGAGSLKTHALPPACAGALSAACRAHTVDGVPPMAWVAHVTDGQFNVLLSEVS